MKKANLPILQIYKAFGLKFASEVPCPEFVKSKGEVDVTIKWGHIPDNYVEPEGRKYFWSASPQHYFLYLKNIGKFLCKEGITVTVEPAPEHDPLQLRVFLFGSVLGAIMHQRGIFPLHASAVERNGIAYAFTGDSGAGKSTLASACLKNGYRLLCDDVCAITKSSNRTLLVQPSYPLVKLSEEMLEKINLGDTAIPLPGIDSPKHRLLINHFSSSISQLKSIIVLANNSDQNSPVEISLLKGVEKIQTLLKNIYRREYIQPMQNEKKVFELCTYLAQNIEVLSTTGGYKNMHPNSIIHLLGINAP
jgi:hypothetical protein